MDTKTCFLAILVCTAGCGLTKEDACNSALAQTAACLDGGTEWSGVDNPDDSRESDHQFRGECHEDIAFAENYLQQRGYSLLGPWDEEAEPTSIATWEFGPWLLGLPADYPITKVGRPHRPGFDNPWGCMAPGPHRTCLLGNIGLRVNLVLPMSHPRPPFEENVIWTVGDPEKWARVTEAGQACCGIREREEIYNADIPIETKADLEWLSLAGVSAPDCADHITFVGTAPMDEYPRSNLGGLSTSAANELKKSEAAAFTRCLNNGGEWDITQAAIKSPISRQGLVYINMDSTLVDDALAWMLEQVDWVPGFALAYQILRAGHQYGVEEEVENWPFFGFMGVCGNACTVKKFYTNDTWSWFSGIECPKNQYCVIDEVNHDEDTEVLGFCAEEHFILPEPPGLGDSSPPIPPGVIEAYNLLEEPKPPPPGVYWDVYPMEHSHGYPHGRIVNLSRIDIYSMAESVMFDYSAGEFPEVFANSSEAYLLLEELGIMPGDEVRMIAGMSMHADEVDLIRTLAHAQRLVLEGKHVRVYHHRIQDDGTTLAVNTDLHFQYLGPMSQNGTTLVAPD
jgi:hypothetical protein